MAHRTLSAARIEDVMAAEYLMQVDSGSGAPRQFASNQDSG